MSNLAAIPPPPPGPGSGSYIENPALGPRLLGMNAIRFIQGLLRALITLGLVVGAIIFMFMLLMGALQWMTSGGDPKAAEAAKTRLTNAFIGLLILFSIFAIIQLVERFFSINILMINIEALKIGG